MVIAYPGEADMKNVRSHIFKFLHIGFKEHTDLRDRLGSSKTLEEIRKIVEEMYERRKDVSSNKKIGWYYRYWNSEGLSITDTPTWRSDDWNT